MWNDVRQRYKLRFLQISVDPAAQTGKAGNKGNRQRPHDIPRRHRRINIAQTRVPRLPLNTWPNAVHCDCLSRLFVWPLFRAWHFRNAAGRSRFYPYRFRR